MSLPKHLQSLSKAQLESLCIGCSMCCRPAVEVTKGVNVIVPELACKHLKIDTDGKSCCSVYETRHVTAKGWCLPLEDAIAKSVFPNECPYVAPLKYYNGAIVLDDRYYELLKPQLQRTIVEKGQPEWASDSVWKAFAGEDLLK
jgi:uncharacterized cysteine cluster protein YcgN (CxxCxxCC family)